MRTREEIKEKQHTWRQIVFCIECREVAERLAESVYLSWTNDKEAACKNHAPDPRRLSASAFGHAFRGERLFRAAPSKTAKSLGGGATSSYELQLHIRERIPKRVCVMVVVYRQIFIKSTKKTQSTESQQLEMLGKRYMYCDVNGYEVYSIGRPSRRLLTAKKKIYKNYFPKDMYVM